MFFPTNTGESDYWLMPNEQFFSSIDMLLHSCIQWADDVRFVL